MNVRSYFTSFTWLCCISLLTAGATIAAAQERAAKIPEVPVARPLVREVTDHEVFSGRMEAVSRVELRCRVSGFLVKAAVADGADVQQGELLFEIDPRPYRIEMDRAEASLILAEARLKLAEANHKRAAALHARGAISQEELAKIVADRAEAEAGVRLAVSGREVARLKLEYTRVLAPIAGRIGRRLIDPGNLVKADETRLAVIVSREPMHVSFDVDERSFLRLMRATQAAGKVEKTNVDIGLPDDMGFPHRGVVDFVDNQVDPATGSLRLRAVVARKDKHFTPGMSVRLRLALGSPRKVLLVPDRAVLTDNGLRFVFLVNDKDELKPRQVKLGRQYDGLRAVEAGLKAEDRVVIGGLGRLRAGMKVQPRLQALPDKESADESDDAGASVAPFSRGSSGPGILVEAVYPGANAMVVSDTVRAPIEQMVGGVAKLRRLRSRCAGDGTFALALTFARGVDLQRAQGLTQNRVNLALPALPDVVKRTGISVTQPSSVLLIVNVTSPDGKYDRTYLSNYASIQLKDEIARVAGIGEVKLMGHGSYALRVWLDPLKLAERELDAGEVTCLLAKEKDAGEVDREKLANLILKADGDGRMIRLRDVARIELGAGGQRGVADYNGKPSVALVVYPTGEANVPELRAALRNLLANLRKRLRDGLALDETFDLTANSEYLLLDLDTPLTAGVVRTEKLLSRCHELLRPASEVEHVLALSENPFDLFGSGPCVLVRLMPAEKRRIAREKVIDSLRMRLSALEEATVRIRDVSPTGRGFGYPVDLALEGPELARVRDWAKELGERLGRNQKLTDVWVNRDSDPRTHWFADIDRETAAIRGVSPQAIISILQIHPGAQHVGDFNSFGRKWRVEVQADMGPGDQAKGLRQLKVRDSRGQMIPLTAVVKLREVTQPPALHFLDGSPMVQITANLTPGVSLDQGRKLCDAAAEDARKELGLEGAYRLTWLQDN